MDDIVYGDLIRYSHGSNDGSIAFAVSDWNRLAGHPLVLAASDAPIKIDDYADKPVWRLGDRVRVSVTGIPSELKYGARPIGFVVPPLPEPPPVEIEITVEPTEIHQPQRAPRKRASR